MPALRDARSKPEFRNKLVRAAVEGRLPRGINIDSIFPRASFRTIFRCRLERRKSGSDLSRLSRHPSAESLVANFALLVLEFEIMISDIGEIFTAQKDGAPPTILASGGAPGESGVCVVSLRYKGRHRRAFAARRTRVRLLGRLPRPRWDVEGLGRAATKGHGSFARRFKSANARPARRPSLVAAESSSWA